MVIRPVDLPRVRIALDQLRRCMAGNHVDIVIVFFIKIRPVPHQFIDRIVIHILIRRIIPEAGVHQQIMLSVHFQFLVDQKLPQKIQDLLTFFLIQLVILIQGRIVSVLLPRPEIVQCLFIQLHNGLFRDLLHQKIHTLQRHQFVIAQDRYRIGHFHQLLQHFDRMRPPVDHIPDQIQRILILQIYFFQQLHELVIFPMDVAHYIGSHIYLPST